MSTKATSTAKRKSIAPTETKKRIYVGPNTSAMKKYTVIDTDFPVHIKTVIEACPSIEKLCVDITQFAEIEARTTRKGTLENKYFEEIVAFNKEGI